MAAKRVCHRTRRQKERLKYKLCDEIILIMVEKEKMKECTEHSWV